VLFGQAEKHELQRADAPDQLTHRNHASGFCAQLAVHGRQGKKDRRDLARHTASAGAGRIEEEFAALARIADPAQQVFEAVHGERG